MTAASVLRLTEAAQLVASNPLSSAWVSANAGAGKTHVFKMRMLRLLLSGAEPSNILCLTYTKAAAAEMSARVFGDLSRWATAPDAALARELIALLERHPSDAELRSARQLFAVVLEAPGGLAIETIHSFCQNLLRRFPLEAGVAPGFDVLDEAGCRELMREAVDAVLERGVGEPNSLLGKALETAVTFAVEDGFDKVMAEALAKREWIEAVSRLDTDSGDPFATAEADYRRLLEMRAGVTADSLTAGLADVIDPADWRRVLAIIEGGAPVDVRAAKRVLEILQADTPATRAAASTAFWLTGKGESRARLLTKTLAERHPGIADMLADGQQRFVALDQEYRALTVVTATTALLRLADAVMQDYAARKARRAALDFDDLLFRASHLLQRSDAAPWIQFKLDGGLDHILVDEAQDTSPVQWSIVEALASELFAAGPRDVPRSLFAVGDEKQSIYSFQGAAPDMFAAAGARFGAAAHEAGHTMRSVPLRLSFRSAACVLESVDRVFADAVRTPGLGAGDAVRHLALRTGQAGVVELWQPAAAVEGAAAEPWSPLEETMERPATAVLAERIAATIAGWLETGERLASEDRPMRPGDILILLRRRKPCAEPVIAALKARGIGVAGADRMQLTQQLAVQDLISLGNWLLLPDDDLALAEVLKSPLFDFDDGDLLQIAPRRTGSLWQALLRHAETQPRFREAVSVLRRWQGWARRDPPFEFYQRVLDQDGMRKRLLARLGQEAAEALDEFVDLALGHDETSAPSLQTFLADLRLAGHEVKRDMEHDRDQVRVMTVHGAKGLEAPVVILADAVWAKSDPPREALCRLSSKEWLSGRIDTWVWTTKGCGALPALDLARADRKRRETEERNRLLYVAMTRARDRLYVTGYEPKRGRDPACWYEHIAAGLAGRLVEARTPGGLSVQRFETRQSAPHEAARAPSSTSAGDQPLPEWALRPAPAEPCIMVPLRPSRIASPVDENASASLATGRVWSPPAPSPVLVARTDKRLRGTLTHFLLQHLPNSPREGWQQAATRFVAKRATELPPVARASIVEEALAILRNPRFAAVFGPDSRAEVPLAARIPNPRAGGPYLSIAGQIDRLVRLPHEVLIVDYKTSRPAPLAVADVASAYLLQLAAYRCALRRAYDDLPIRAALVWTEGARLMPIADDVLDAHERQLWTLAERPT